jgi:hypothetical protein
MNERKDAVIRELYEQVAELSRVQTAAITKMEAALVCPQGSDHRAQPRAQARPSRQRQRRMNAERRPVRIFPAEEALRAEAVRIARYACDGDKGRIVGDPVFEAVTEGRQRWKGYSACGDLYAVRDVMRANAKERHQATV